MARRPVARFVLVFGLLVAAACAALVVLVPRWVKSKIIAAAAAHGVALSIDDLAIRPGRARLTGVRATPLIRADAKGAPNATATAQTVDVDLDGLTPTAMTVTGMHVVLDGSIDALRDALTPRDLGAANASPLQRVTVKDASLVWTHSVPVERIAIDAEHVQGDVARAGGRPLGQDWHFETSELRAFGKKALPAWTASADSDDKGMRATLGLPKAARIAMSSEKSGARTLDVDTPDATIVDLGVPPEMLGLYGDETSRFELHLHHRQSSADQADGTLVAAAKNVFLGASTARTSFAIDARYDGDPKTALRITAGTLRAGPFTGAITGGFAVDPQAGLKASLRYASGVMSCLDAVKAQAASYGDLGKGVAALAGMLGFDRAVEGRISLKGEIEVDTRTNQNRFAFHTEGDCKLSYLPSL
ncbi:MAG TPA: hypothetical protein VGH28_07425 [Polyangiaceae bacterium]|jgi:hypothetical protein